MCILFVVERSPVNARPLLLTVSRTVSQMQICRGIDTTKDIPRLFRRLEELCRDGTLPR